MFLLYYLTCQKCLVDLSSLGGRPKDIKSSVFSDLQSSIHNDEMREALSEEGECLVVATSNGNVGVFSARALDQGEPVEEAQLADASIRVEPRLTSVVTWAPFVKGDIVNDGSQFVMIIFCIERFKISVGCRVNGH